MTGKPGFFGRIFKSLGKDTASSQQEPKSRKSKNEPQNSQSTHHTKRTADKNQDREKMLTRSGREIDVNELETIRRHSVFYRHNVHPSIDSTSSLSATPTRRRAMSEVSSKSASGANIMVSPRIRRRNDNYDHPQLPPLPPPPQLPSSSIEHKIVPRRQSSNSRSKLMTRGGDLVSPSDDDDEEDDEMITPAGAGNTTPEMHKKTTVEIQKRRHSMQGLYLPRINSGSSSIRDGTYLQSPSSRGPAGVGRHEGRSPSDSEALYSPTTEDETPGGGEGKTRGSQVTNLSKKECKLIVALMSEPRNKKNRNKYVKYLIKKDRLAEAENVLESGLLLHKSDWQLHFQFGVFCYDFLQKPHKAETYLRTALRLNPSASCIHTHLGILIRRRGNSALAEDHFIDALNLNALDFTALGGLVELLREDNRYETAYQYLIRTYEKLDPSLDASQIDMISFRHVLSLAEDIAGKISVSSPIPDHVRQY